MRVKNLNGAHHLKCCSSSWLAYWEEVSGQEAYLCAVKDCIGQPSTGGLVQRDSTIDSDWYVVPLCDTCSKLTREELDIWDQVRLVAVHEQRTSRAAPHRGWVPAPRISESLS